VTLCGLLALRGGIARPEAALLLLAYAAYLAGAIAAG
jgi:hypothetical protein